MRKGLDIEAVLHRVKVGEVTEQEIAKVVETLEDGASSDSYRLLYIIARAGARQYEHVVARFIDYSLDPQVAALALTSLCVQWGLSSRYRNRIFEGLAGLAWDSFDEFKQGAISAAGEHLRENSDEMVLERLIGIADSRDGGLNSRFATEALARALGEPHSGAVYPRGVDEDTWRQSMLDRARRRLATENPYRCDDRAR